MNYYVVGQIWADTKEGMVWSLFGLFDSIDKAEPVCLDDSYFIGPVELNKDQGPEKEIWKGLYFPTQRKEGN